MILTGLAVSWRLFFMIPLRHSRARQRGQGATPVLVFAGIVVLSVIFFFALTLPARLERKKRAAAAAAASASAVSSDSAPATPEIPGAVPVPGAKPSSVPEHPLASAPLPARFASPKSLVQTIAEKLAAGDVAAVAALAGQEVLPAEKEAFLQSILREAKLTPAPPSAVREIGDVADLYRWAIPFVAANGTAAAPFSEESAPAVSAPQGRSIDGKPVVPEAAPSSAALSNPTEASGSFWQTPRLEIDVARDAAAGWKIAAVHFPEALRNAVARMLGAARVPAAIAGPADEANDPLKIAESFLRAVLKQDYTVARTVTDTEKVTREKVAGLCILFEEGGYTIAEDRPLSATAAGSDSAWVIVKLRSGVDGQESDFGLELQKLPTGAWQVAGVNFSKMLATYAAASGASEGVAYTPIVNSPGGGESLVVYFDFNEAGLVPRARRQLEIVANLLRDDPRRKLRLSGHADAVGSDSYNRQLSAARAYAVKNFLSELGVSAAQIATEGLGTLRPLDPNTKPDGTDNPEGRSRNRRTEIFLDF